MRAIIMFMKVETRVSSGIAGINLPIFYVMQADKPSYLLI
jgi:hypothetical protein